MADEPPGGTITFPSPANVLSALAAARDLPQLRLLNALELTMLRRPHESAPGPAGRRAFLVEREGRFPEVVGRLPDLLALPAALGLPADAPRA